MSKVFINEETLIGIGNAIREKGGTIDLIATTDMANAITNLPSGGGELPEEAFLITGDCSYRFAQNGWNWFVDMYGNRLTTNDMYNISSIFNGSSELEIIPFEFNLRNKYGNDMRYIFYNCNKLKSVPNITCTNTNPIDMTNIFSYCYELTELPYLYNAYPVNISGMFSHCRKIREIPDDYFDTWNFERLTTYAYANVGNLFAGCLSLRKIPKKLFENLKETAITSAYSSLYYSCCANCYNLDELVDIPVLQLNYTSNLFSGSFSNLYRLKDFKFETNEDGTPKIARWKNQVLELSSNTGYKNYATPVLLENWTESIIKTASAPIVSYNSGVTIDKAIFNAETYAALKNDPDAFCLANSQTPVDAYSNYGYSRYTHRSAVETINSLPDTSAYLATAGGTNTIKFKGAAGALTDEGAINTLTDAEIAVAAAKGWTVAMS